MVRNFLISLLIIASATFTVSAVTSITSSGIQASPIPNDSKYRITGVVLDTIGEGEPFATLRIFTSSDTIHPVTMGVTNEDGVFNLPLRSAGKYSLIISATGKETISLPVSITTNQPVADLGTITTNVATNLLGIVEVVAQRPLVSREIDRIGYDVQADEESKTSQLDDILRKVPMVSVDSDGTIRVKGSSDFKIYKNGRPNNSFTRNAKDIFKAIPASMIKKIEVITDPGAREDAEGVGAILNIVTLENTVVKGVMGAANIMTSTLNPVPAPNLWLTSQIDKVTFSISGGYNNMNKRRTRNKSVSIQKYDTTGDEIISETASQSPGHIVWGNGELSYELDSLNLFTAEFGGYRYVLDIASAGSVKAMTGSGTPLYSYISASRINPYGYLDFNGNFNYQHLTGRKGETFTLSYAISTTNQQRNSETDYDDYINLPVPYTWQKSDYDLNFVEHTVQADWTRPIGSRQTLDLGGKFILRDNHSITTNDYSNDERQHYDFLHRTSIGALYADYRISFGKLSARAGMRYEYSHLSAKYRDGSQEPFGSDLNDFVPSVAMSYTPNPASSFKLSYNTTINRPGISYLNPARTETPTTVSYGNPDLGSARIQNFTFNYGYIHPKVNINLSLSYIFTNDAIIPIQWSEENVTYSTFENQGRNRTFSPSLYFNWNITRNTSLMYNGEIGYNHYANNSLGIRAHGWRRNQYIRLAQKLPWKLNLSLSMMEMGSHTSLYSRSTQPSFWDGIWYTVNLRRSFLKEDRLTVSLGVNNIGMRPMRMRTESYNSGYTGESTTTMGKRQECTISLSYRFGSLNAAVKKTAKSIANDDLVGRKQ
ncbi:MAG: TonB-dependent receptor [Duncaniella sp.]|nr:TonB-dependent receptor [Duncaniella sp.]